MYTYDRLILGYHGCDIETAERVLAGESFIPSENIYDWLGKGVYFWEHGPDRALAFAHMQVRRGRAKRPAVVGAVLQLGNCFDLLDTRFTERLAAFYPLWRKGIRARGAPLPQNEGKSPYFMKRVRDCAVLNDYVDWLRLEAGIIYDTVRGCFLEGTRVFPKSGIFRQAHIQIAVRNPEACIVGVFRPTMR